MQLRAGVLPLNIELGRHRQIELQDRKCVLCYYDEVEDEFHFICKCPFYKNNRIELYNNLDIDGMYVLTDKERL